MKRKTLYSNRPRGRWSSRSKKFEPDICERVTLSIYPETLRRVEFLAERRGLTLDTMVEIALQNELELVNPFTYVTSEPTTVYESRLFSHEASQVVMWLAKHPAGVGLELVWLYRKEMGISDKKIIAEAIRECSEQGMIVFLESDDRKYPLVKLTADSTLNVRTFQVFQGRVVQTVPKKVFEDEIDSAKTGLMVDLLNLADDGDDDDE